MSGRNTIGYSTESFRGWAVGVVAAEQPIGGISYLRLRVGNDRTALALNTSRSLSLTIVSTARGRDSNFSFQLQCEGGCTLSVVRLLVVDDFEPWRHFVRSILQVTNVEIVDVASDGLEAVQKAEALQPDLIVLDISLPQLEGIDAARQMRAVAPKSKILFLSQVSDPDVVRAALRVGARGYVVKDDAVRDLVAAVEAVVLGKHFFSKALTGYDFSDLTQP